MRWLRFDVALPYALLLSAGLMIVGAVWAEQRSTDRKSDITTSRLAAAQDIATSMEELDRDGDGICMQRKPASRGLSRKTAWSTTYCDV
jgi:hypothetical protein